MHVHACQVEERVLNRAGNCGSKGLHYFPVDTLSEVIFTVSEVILRTSCLGLYYDPIKTV